MINASGGQRDLYAAVVKQAVDDLESKDDLAVYEANEFFQQQSGGWAQSRRFYFSALGLDEESVIAHLRSRLTMPERPDKKWTSDEIYSILPTHAFRAKEISNQTSIRYNQTTTRLQHLQARGLIVRVDRGVYVRADCYDAWVDEMLAAQPEPEPPTTIIEALQNGPMTMRELGIAFDGDVGQDAIRQRLERARASGRVVKEGTSWRLAA